MGCKWLVRVVGGSEGDCVGRIDFVADQFCVLGGGGGRDGEGEEEVVGHVGGCVGVYVWIEEEI